MARSPLEEELRGHGCETPVGQFQDTITDIFKSEFSQFSVDSLCHHPSEALAFVERIRRQQKDFATLPEDVILRNLMARRKNPVKK
jgi:hypothetical protein